MSGNSSITSDINMSSTITPTATGEIPSGYFLAGPVGTAASEISVWRTLTTYDMPPSMSFDITYDTLGNVLNLSYVDGSVQNLQHDTLGNVTTIVTTTPLGMTETQILNYSSLGNITSIDVSYE